MTIRSTSGSAGAAVHCRRLESRGSDRRLVVGAGQFDGIHDKALSTFAGKEAGMTMRDPRELARQVTPLGLAQSGSQLYLTALCHESRIEKSFRIDRIASYRLVD